MPVTVYPLPPVILNHLGYVRGNEDRRADDAELLDYLGVDEGDTAAPGAD